MCFVRALESISTTFYNQLVRQFPFSKKLQTQTVSTEKLHKKHFRMKKLHHKMLVKLIPCVCVRVYFETYSEACEKVMPVKVGDNVSVYISQPVPCK